MPKRTRDSKKSSGGRPQKIKRVKEVVFDTDKRAEFLTGFSKRKKAREAAARQRAIDREREEAKESRQAMRDERKKRAAMNVRNAKELYGDADEADHLSHSDSDSDSDSEDAEPTQFESTSLITTVSVEPFSLSRSPSPVAPAFPSTSTSASTQPRPKTEKGKRRVKSAPQQRPKMSREDKKERAKAGKGEKKRIDKRGAQKGKGKVGK